VTTEDVPIEEEVLPLTEEVKKICMEDCDAPPVFFDMMGYHLISSTAGMCFRPMWLKIKRPNIYCIMASIPGRERRSSVMELHDILVDTSLMEYYVLIKNISRDDAWKLVTLSKIESGTEAGICDAILEGINGIEVTDGRKVSVDSFRFCSPEFGPTLKRMSSEKDPERGVDSLLCKFYSGEAHNYRLNQGGKTAKAGENRSRFIPVGLYFTMFSSMQEPQNFLTQKMNDIGLLRRTKIGYVKTSDLKMTDWKSPFGSTISSIDCHKQLRLLAKKEIVPKMIKYHKLLQELRNESGCEEDYLNVDFDTESRKVITEMARKVDEALITDCSSYNIYKQSDWEHVSKYAILNAISRDNWMGGNNPKGMLFVEIEDTNKAIADLKAIDSNASYIIDSIGKTEKMQETGTILDRMESHIRRGGSAGRTRTQVAQRWSTIHKDELDLKLLTLIDQEKIFEAERPARGGGKKATTIYVHMTYRDEYE